ncbi:MAG: hypothetical protein K9K35_10445 [Rhodoferax sp.]|nr:hypothetical protein [Rhodoferax sp.]
MTIVISDTPEGGLTIWNDLVPIPGKRCSIAEVAALDIISRTRREYGLPLLGARVERISGLEVVGEVDMDAVYHARKTAEKALP